MPVAGSSKQKPRGALGKLKDEIFGTKEERKAEKLRRKEAVSRCALNRGLILIVRIGPRLLGSPGGAAPTEEFSPPTVLR
jgi:hypothetical protein